MRRDGVNPFGKSYQDIGGAHVLHADYRGRSGVRRDGQNRLRAEVGAERVGDHAPIPRPIVGQRNNLICVTGMGRRSQVGRIALPLITHRIGIADLDREDGAHPFDDRLVRRLNRDDRRASLPGGLDGAQNHCGQECQPKLKL